jgi:biopolymer transport protein ExbD
MLDTLFILLFALLALSDARDVSEAEEVRIQLPEVERGTDTSAGLAEVFSIFVDEQSQVRIEGSEEVLDTLDSLDAALTARVGDALPEDVSVDIVADANARHGVTVELLQHLRLRGFVRVQLLATGSDTGGSLGGGGR